MEFPTNSLTRCLSYVKILVLLFAPFHRQAHAQPLMSGSQNAVLAHSSVAVSGTKWPDVNPASLPVISTFQLSLFASEAYGLKELRSGATNLLVPMNRSTLGLTAHFFGYEKYKEITAKATLTRAFSFGTSRNLTVGLSVSAMNQRVRHTFDRTSLALSGGLLVELWPGLYMGVAANEWLQLTKLTSQEETLILGLGYTLLEATQVVLSIKKTIQYPSSLGIGFEHLIESRLTVRASMGSNPYRAAIGIDVEFNTLKAGVLAEKHMVLGWTPALSIDIYTQ